MSKLCMENNPFLGIPFPNRSCLSVLSKPINTRGESCIPLSHRWVIVPISPIPIPWFYDFCDCLLLCFSLRFLNLSINIRSAIGFQQKKGKDSALKDSKFICLPSSLNIFWWHPLFWYFVCCRWRHHRYMCIHTHSRDHFLGSIVLQIYICI